MTPAAPTPAQPTFCFSLLATLVVVAAAGAESFLGLSATIGGLFVHGGSTLAMVLGLCLLAAGALHLGSAVYLWCSPPTDARWLPKAILGLLLAGGLGLLAGVVVPVSLDPRELGALTAGFGSLEVGALWAAVSAARSYQRATGRSLLAGPGA